MKALFGVLSLLVVLALVGVLARKQLSAVNGVQVPGASLGSDAPMPAKQQAQQVQQQFKAAAEAAVQQPRTMPDDK